ncbi:MAG: hypothetical protein AB1894_29090 [Chloroflexota bacterium]
MDIFFTDPTEVPLPPAEVRIQALRADPWPDGRRVRVFMEIDPSQKRPSADLAISNEQGQEVATASIIENVIRHLEITMHLRGAQAGETYTLQATLYFASLPEPDSPDDQENRLNLPVERMIVDTRQVTFFIPSQD